MKLSVVEIVIVVVGVAVIAPLLAMLLTPSTDPITMGLIGFGGVAVFLILFAVTRWLVQRA